MAWPGAVPRILAEQQGIVNALALQFPSVEKLIQEKYQVPKKLKLGGRRRHLRQEITQI